MRRDARLLAHRQPSTVRSERKPMNRIALPLGLAALLVSSAASAIKVPTGSDDLNLTPTLRTLGYPTSGGQVQVEAPIDILFQPLDRGFRNNGAALRGFIPGHLIHFRAGVWEGFHSQPAAGTNAPVNPGGKPMIGA